MFKKNLSLEEQLQRQKWNDIKIKVEEEFKKNVCAKIPNAFWHSKKHEICLPFKENFKEPIGNFNVVSMNKEKQNICEYEKTDLLRKGMTKHSNSPWSFHGFYIYKHLE